METSVEKYQKQLLDQAQRMYYENPITEVTQKAYMATPRHLFVKRYREWAIKEWNEVNENNLESHLAKLYRDGSLILFGDEMDNPLTINQALWVSRIYTLFEAKALGDLNDTSKVGDASQHQSTLNAILTSMLNNLKNIDELRAVVNTLALNEKVFRNDYPTDDYPSNRDDVLYYWMCDAELYGILPEGDPPARDLITRFHKEFSSKFTPEQKSKSEREAITKRLMKKNDKRGTR